MTALWLTALTAGVLTAAVVGYPIGAVLAGGRREDDCRRCMAYRERVLREGR